MPDDRLEAIDVHLLIDSLPALVRLIDGERRCVYCNRSWLDFTGMRPGQALAHGWLDALHPDDRDVCVDGFDQAFSARRDLSLEYRLRRGDGEYRWVFERVRARNDAAGRFAGYVGCAVETGERRAGMPYEQLQQAQRLQAVGQMTCGIAHDFNNTLGSILGYSGLARARCVTDPDSKLAFYLQEIHTAGERARDLVRQVLDFGRGADTGAVAQQLQPLVEGALKLLRSTLPAGLELTARLDTDTPPVAIDPIQLHQAVVNLCIHARDSLHGNGNVELRVQRRDGLDARCSACGCPVRGDWVELAVGDDGETIEAADRRRMFAPSPFSGASPAAGAINLYIVSDIVHRHGGHVVVESAVGQGREFRLLFPPAAAGATQPVDERAPDMPHDDGRVLPQPGAAAPAGRDGG